MPFLPILIVAGAAYVVAACAFDIRARVTDAEIDAKGGVGDAATAAANNTAPVASVPANPPEDASTDVQPEDAASDNENEEPVKV